MEKSETNFNFKIDGQKFGLNCVFLKDSLSQSLGLMFKSYKKAKISAFIFKPAKKVSLTTWFCSFPILVLYLKKGDLVDFKTIRPGKCNVPANFEADRIVEIPLKEHEFENLNNVEYFGRLVNKIPELEKVKSSSRTKALNTS
jgi:uncharacterized membrane protein (UPF0127 family)